MSNQDTNFIRFQDGNFPVLTVPSGGHELNVWQQSHCLAKNSFDNLKLVLDVLETCRQRVSYVRKTVGSVRGTLPKCDQHPLASGQAPQASDNDDTNAKRYRFEMARSALREMRMELLQAITCLTLELKRNSIENPEHKPGSMTPTMGRLFKHSMLLAFRALKAAKSEADSAGAYLEELPEFPHDADKVYAAASFDFKHSGF